MPICGRHQKPVHICLFRSRTKNVSACPKNLESICAGPSVFGVGRYRWPDVDAGQIYLVPQGAFGQMSVQIGAHWCSLVSNGIEKAKKSKDLVYDFWIF